MRIIIVTPLYPPDVAPLAEYTKELARRLAQSTSVTLIAYASIPEAIPGVRIIAVPKHTILPFRLVSLFIALLKEIKKEDIVYAQNGPSVELPLFGASFIHRVRYILRLGDPVGYTYSQGHRLTQRALGMLMRRVQCVVADPSLVENIDTSLRATHLRTPDARPEILPFSPYPTHAFEAFEKSWTEHIQTLNHIFTHEHTH